jgi:hypothetical protein
MAKEVLRLAKEARKSGIALKQLGIATPFSDARLALKETSYKPSLQVGGGCGVWGQQEQRQRHEQQRHTRCPHSGNACLPWWTLCAWECSRGRGDGGGGRGRATAAAGTHGACRPRLVATLARPRSPPACALIPMTLQGRFDSKLDLKGRNQNGSVYIPPRLSPPPPLPPPANLMEKVGRYRTATCTSRHVEFTSAKMVANSV